MIARALRKSGTLKAQEARYKDGADARITVIKLGLSAEASGDLQLYRTSDRQFPYHPTYIQWFSRTRFEAYRRLGYENAVRASRSVE